jgi:hypothetical protein
MDRARWTIGLGAAAAGGFALLLVVAFTYAVFLGTADHVPGSVAKVTSETSCSRSSGTTSARRGLTGTRMRSCTTSFTADVRFREAGGGQLVARVPAGSVGGEDADVRLAELKVGDAVPIVYSRPTPTWAYRDTAADVFGAFWWWARFPAVLVVAPVVFWLVTVRALPARSD